MYYPQVSGPYGWQLVIYNGAEVVIPGFYQSSFSPQVDNGQVVWSATSISPGNSDTEIYFFNGAETIPLTDDSFNDYAPQIDNGYIVWYGDNGMNYDIYLYEIASGYITNISNSKGADYSPQINEGKVVWYGQDNKEKDYEIFVYDIKRKNKKQLTNNNYDDYSPQINNGKIAWTIYKDGFSDSDIMLAEPIDLQIINMGDGESIKLIWSEQSDEVKKIAYKAYRKEESLVDEAANWVQVKIDDEDIAPDKDTGIVTLIDTRQSRKDIPQTDSNYIGPKRGVVYDYKIEVYNKVTGAELGFLGVLGDIDGDGQTDYLKGVTEPFVMLIRGYGTDELIYWNAFKEDLRVYRQFRDSDQDYEVGGKIYKKPKTIWDTALTFASAYDPYIYPGGDDNRIGQLDSFATGAAVFQELSGIKYDENTGFKEQEHATWLSELKSACNRYAESGEVILDYVPEHMYIYSHSMGGPNARYLEYLIDKYREQDQEAGKNIPYVKKNVMLSPANCGSTLARDLCSKQGVELIFAETMSEKKVDWGASKFLKPEKVAMFNKEVKPSLNTKYYFLGGHNWFGGGFGKELPDGQWELSVMKSLFGYITLLTKEADYYLPLPFTATEMKNDNAVTVKMQRGEFTDKVWKVIKEFGLSGEKQEYEFRPNQEVEDHFKVLPTMPLNHYYGVTQNEVMMGSSWIQLDIPPRIPDDLTVPDESYPDDDLFPPLADEVVLYPHSERIALATEEEEEERVILVPSTNSWYLAVFKGNKTMDISLKLINPDEEVIDGKEGNLPADTYYGEDDSGVMYALKSPQEGLWKLKVKATGGAGSYADLFILAETNMQIIPLFSGLNVGIGEPVQLDLKLLEGEYPLLNGMVTACLTKNSDNSETTISLLDDGIHDNLIAGDGIYGNLFTDTLAEDSFSIEYAAEVTALNGNPAILKASGGFEVMFKQIINIGEAVNIENIGDGPPYEGLKVEVMVSFGLPNPYVITAELYDPYDNYVAHGEGEVRGEPGEEVLASIYFKGEDINASGLSGPYTVKNIFVSKNTTSLDFGINTELTVQTDFLSASDFKFRDTDEDGLSDAREQELGTDKTLADTDSDGLSDYKEVYYDTYPDYTPGLDTDPVVSDTDLDGWIDGLDDFPLDPCEWLDSDGDGVGDNSDAFPDDPTQWENLNEKPVAVITGETVYELATAQGTQISLSAVNSYDPDEADTIESCTWTGPFGTVQGEILEVVLPLGEHQISLVVNDGEVDSEAVTITIKVLDSIAPAITIHSPESKTYKISEESPVLSYEVSDIGGILEEEAILNGVAIENGAIIKLSELLAKEENKLVITAFDSSGNQSALEVVFKVENSPQEILTIIRKAVIYGKMPFSVGVQLTVQLKLYDRFIRKAKVFEDRGLVWVARIFKKIAESALSNALRTLRRKERKIDKEVYELLTTCIENLIKET